MRARASPTTRAWTSAPGGAFQVPSLVGIGTRGPFMHDGCAATLRDRFNPACGGAQHGMTDKLTAGSDRRPRRLPADPVARVRTRPSLQEALRSVPVAADGSSRLTKVSVSAERLLDLSSASAPNAAPCAPTSTSWSPARRPPARAGGRARSDRSGPALRRNSRRAPSPRLQTGQATVPSACPPASSFDVGIEVREQLGDHRLQHPDHVDLREQHPPCSWPQTRSAHAATSSVARQLLAHTGHSGSDPPMPEILPPVQRGGNVPAVLRSVRSATASRSGPAPAPAGRRPGRPAPAADRPA